MKPQGARNVFFLLTTDTQISVANSPEWLTDQKNTNSDESSPMIARKPALEMGMGSKEKDMERHEEQNPDSLRIQESIVNWTAS